MFYDKKNGFGAVKFCGVVFFPYFCSPIIEMDYCSEQL